MPLLCGVHLDWQGHSVRGWAVAASESCLRVRLDSDDAPPVDELVECSMGLGTAGETSVTLRVAAVRSSLQRTPGAEGVELEFEPTGERVDDFCAFRQRHKVAVGWVQGVESEARSENLGDLQEALESAYDVLHIPGTLALDELMRDSPLAVVVLSPLGDQELYLELLACLSQYDIVSPKAIVLLPEKETYLLPALSNSSRVFYTLPLPKDPSHLLAVLDSSIEQAWIEGFGPTSVGQTEQIHQIINLARQLSVLGDLHLAGRLIIEHTLSLVNAERAYFLLYDSDSDSLESEEMEQRATGGLAGFVAKTGISTHLAYASRDARFLQAIDDPDGDGNVHLAIDPLKSSQGTILAVLIAAREEGRAAFSDQDRETMDLLSSQLAPFVDQIRFQARVHSLTARRHLDEVGRDADLFSVEAIEARAQVDQYGQLLNVSGGVLRWASWVLVGISFVALTLSATVQIPSYVSGVAVTRISPMDRVLAPAEGRIDRVLIALGDEVAQGDVLAGADGVSADSPMLFLAPQDGFVARILAQEGDDVVHQEVVFEIVPRDAQVDLVGHLPGRIRQALAPGQALWWTPEGSGQTFKGTLEYFSSSVTSTQQAHQFTGGVGEPGLAGPRVVFRARLSIPANESKQWIRQFHDGLVGRAEVRVGSRSLLWELKNIVSDEQPESAQ